MTSTMHVAGPWRFALLKERDTKLTMKTVALTSSFLFFFVGAAMCRTPSPPRLIESQMQRAILSQAMEAGPQRFIAGLRVKPAFEDKRFLGYKLVGYTTDSPLTQGAAVVAGDIILAVNGASLERPDQFMQAWQSIAKQNQLEVLLLRNGERLLFRWTLVP